MPEPEPAALLDKLAAGGGPVLNIANSKESLTALLSVDPARGTT
jgi:hypothetical protein